MLGTPCILYLVWAVYFVFGAAPVKPGAAPDELGAAEAVEPDNHGCQVPGVEVCHFS